MDTVGVDRQTQLEAGFRLGRWRVRPRAGLLLPPWPGREGRRVEPKAMQVLLALAHRPGEFQSKDELLNRVWGARPVTEDCLTGAVHALRQALGDDPRAPEFIETRKNVGYRLVAPVRLRAGVDRRWMSAAAMAAVMLVSGSLLVFRNASTDGGQHETIAVAPFMNLSQSADQAYLAVAMTDTLIQELAQRPGLRVIARGSVLSADETPDSIQALADRVNASLVVTGSVQLLDQQLRVKARLVDPDTGVHLWARQYDRPFTAWLKLQEDIGSAIAHQVGRVAGPLPANAPIQAQQLSPAQLEQFLQARYELALESGPQAHRALTKFEALVQEAPDFGPAQLGVAQSLLSLFKMREVGLEQLDRALHAAHLAETLDGESAASHRCIGQLLLLRDWNFAAAERHYLQALRLNPSDVVAHRRYAWLLVARQQYALAQEHIEQIRLLDPQYFDSPEMAALLLYAGEVDAAIAELDRIATHAEAPSRWVYRLQARAYDISGETNRTRAALVRLLSEDLGLSGAQRLHLATLDRDALYRLLLKEAENLSPVLAAGYHAALGEHDDAISLLEEAVAVHDPAVIYLDALPEFHALRSYPAFQTLLSKIGVNGQFFFALSGD